MSVSLAGTSSTTGSVSINGSTGVQGTISSLGISTSANESVVIGYGGATQQQGVNNVFAGYEVAALSTTGNNNVGVGFQAATNLAGDGNVLIGSSAATGLSLANGNVVVGVGAASLLQSAYSNVLIGAGTDSTDTNASAAIAIGANARASGGNGNAQIAGVALGRGSIANGRYALALGTGVNAVGDGSFTVANRVRGYHSIADPGSYVVQIDADALKIANGGMIAFTPRTLTAISSASMSTPLDQQAAWRAGMEDDDLVFRSVGGAVVRFMDDYVSGVLDFVATHCSEWGNPVSDASVLLAHKAAVEANVKARRHPLSYLVVSSAADEAGLAHDAVPTIKLCSSPQDARAAFGVVAADQSNCHTIGHLSFGRSVASNTVIVNSLGEGWIWVDLPEGSAVRNGDLLSAVPSRGGLAAVSADPDIVTTTTIAKATMSMQGCADGCALVPCTYRF